MSPPYMAYTSYVKLKYFPAGTTSFNVMVVVAATVVVLVFVFAITCMVAKRRRNKA